MVTPFEPIHIVNNRVRVIVRLTPKGSRNSVTGLSFEADGKAVLKASVTAVPEAGKANKALLRLLAEEWKLPKSALTIIKGIKERRKTVEIGTDLDIVQPRLESWIKNLLTNGVN